MAYRRKQKTYYNLYVIISITLLSLLLVVVALKGEGWICSICCKILHTGPCDLYNNNRILQCLLVNSFLAGLIALVREQSTLPNNTDKSSLSNKKKLRKYFKVTEQQASFRCIKLSLRKAVELQTVFSSNTLRY